MFLGEPTRRRAVLPAPASLRPATYRAPLRPDSPVICAGLGFDRLDSTGCVYLPSIREDLLSGVGQFCRFVNSFYGLMLNTFNMQSFCV